MKDYHTISSLAGLRLPHAGVVIEHVADALQIKAEAFTDPALQRQARRYFAGERIDANAVAVIIDRLVTTLVPQEIQLPAEAEQDPTLRAFLADLVPMMARRWDHIAANVNFDLYPVSEKSDLPIPPLRLFMLDLGLRVGGWAAVRDMQGKAIDWDFAWTKPRPFAEAVQRWQKQRGLTVESAAAELGVSTQTMSAWRNGLSDPAADHFIKIASCFHEQDESLNVTEFRIRLLVALQSLRRQLDELCGADVIQDMVDALKLTARHVHGFLVAPFRVPPPDTLDIEALIQHRRLMTEGPQHMLPRMWNLALYGSICPIAGPMCEMLALRAEWRPEVAADFRVLGGNWTDRIKYWMHELGATPGRAEYLRRHPIGERLGIDANVFAKAAVRGQMRMAKFDWQPPPDWQTAVFEPPPHGKAMNRVVQAEREASAGNLRGAVEHMLHAVKHQPEDACVHFFLGGFLWQLGHKERDSAKMEQGLWHCRRAVQLDPEFGNARNEVGIVLSNLRRHHEAEDAFAEAEPYHGDHAHHWFSRGNNYLALGRYDQACVAFERTIALTKGGAHVLAMARLAATFVKLGRKGDARRLGQKVFHLVGKDPTEQWEKLLDVWGDHRN